MNIPSQKTKSKKVKTILHRYNIKSFTPLFPTIENFGRINNTTTLRVYVKCLDASLLITNLFSFQIPKEIRSHESEEDFLQINLTGLDDIVPMIAPTKYSKELISWKKS